MGKLAMGKLANKIKRSISRRRRKEPSSAAAGAGGAPRSESEGSSYEFRVVSNPKEYSGDDYTDLKKKGGDGVDNDNEFKINTFPAGGATVSTGVTDTDVSESPTQQQQQQQQQAVGWGWLSSCLGYQAATTADDDDDARQDQDASFESSYDGTGESSQPSMSRLDQILDLKSLSLKKTDDISDITSLPSIDSNSDAESKDSKSESS